MYKRNKLQLKLLDSLVTKSGRPKNKKRKKKERECDKMGGN